MDSSFSRLRADVSPPLAWEDAPDGAKSLVLIIDDPDAPDPKAPKPMRPQTTPNYSGTHCSHSNGVIDPKFEAK
jgi:phosphatidylethanolamine-binding protein (PEBP) family uncharacterized protein